MTLQVGGEGGHMCPSPGKGAGGGASAGTGAQSEMSQRVVSGRARDGEQSQVWGRGRVTERRRRRRLMARLTGDRLQRQLCQPSQVCT